MGHQIYFFKNSESQGSHVKMGHKTKVKYIEHKQHKYNAPTPEWSQQYDNAAYTRDYDDTPDLTVRPPFSQQ